MRTTGSCLLKIAAVSAAVLAAVWTPALALADGPPATEPAVPTSTEPQEIESAIERQLIPSGDPVTVAIRLQARATPYGSRCPRTAA